MNSRILAAVLLTSGLAVVSAAAQQTANSIRKSAPADFVVLEKHTVRDGNAVHKDAVHLLVPKGWKVDGGIVWYPNHTHQANAEVKVFNPQGLEQVEFLPYKPYYWAQQWVVPFPKGSNYMGSEVQPPTDDPKTFIAQFVLPRHRAGARIISYTELPEVAKAVGGGNGAGTSLRAGKTRIEYALANQNVEEDIFVVLSVVRANIAGNVMWQWGADRVFALRAAKGELDARSNLLLSIVNSAQVDQRWFCEYLYVCDLFKHRMNQGIVNAAKLSATITANSDAIFKMYSDAYWNRQASQEKIHAKFSDYIRGVQSYHSPYEKYAVQLPSGYNYAWTNAQGQYVLSNNAGFNPNVGSTQSWTQMKVK